MRYLPISLVVLWALALPALAQSSQTATADFQNAEGNSIGSAVLTQTPAGVLIEVDVTDLPAGEHGFHIHETGTCDPETDFESAGGHYAPNDRNHGFKDEQGPHAGDMPNQFVQDDGVLSADIINPNVTLGSGTGNLFDDDGSAIVIHANADDYTSQPSGDAGARLACAVIEQS